MIFISAGHHPAAPGAKFERFIEHDEAVIWASELVDKLSDEATLVPPAVLKTKVDFINSRIMNGDIAVELHFNSAVSNGEHVGRGSETLYFPGSDRGLALAVSIQNAISVIFAPNRGAKEGWYHMDKSRGPDFFLAKTKCAAVIVEPEFVHRFEIIRDNKNAAIDAMAAALKGFVDG